MTQVLSHDTPRQLDPRLKRTRRALVHALLGLLNTKTFDDISIREITTSAGVGYATFYRHYASKDQLLHELARTEVAKLVDIALPVVFSANMRESCRALCVTVEENKGLWRAMLSGAASGVVREEFIRRIGTLKGQYDVFTGPAPEEVQLICATGATLDVLTWWLSQKPASPLEQVLDILDWVIGTLTPPRAGADAPP